jgi:squalene-associated FAD-dependent desaturase
VSIAVIGGGYAGMAAAVTLANAGVPVTVYEAARELGGRARRVIVNDVALDNGLHILLGAYGETLRLIRAVHPHPGDALKRLPLDWHVHRRFRLRAAPLPAPLHLAVGLATASGAPVRERLAAVRFVRAMRAQRFVLAQDTTVAQLLVAHDQGDALIRYLWKPLCVAALNTPPAQASAQVFLNVLRDGLDAGRAAGEMLLARADLSSLFPIPAAEFVCARSGTVHMSHTIDALTAEGGDVLLQTRSGTHRHAHAICAVSPHRAAALLRDLPSLAHVVKLLERFRYQPIYSLYLQFATQVRLPTPMLAIGESVHWLFDREAICGQRGLLAAVISAEGAHEHMTHDDLAKLVMDEIAAELGPLPRLAWHRVIAEKRATFECSAGLERPPTRTAMSNVHLAGDYTAGDYPATLESAVRSGIAAARQILRNL